MAEPDYSLASRPYVPPAANPLETLQGIERYRMLQTENKIKGLEAQQKEVDVNALKNYGENPDTRVLRGASPEIRTGATAGERGEQENKKDIMSRDANYIKGEQNPRLKQILWDHKRADYLKRGWIDQKTHDMFPTPNDGVLDNLARGNVSVEQYNAITGNTAANEARGRAPYEGKILQPGERYQYPSVAPGGPLEGGTQAPSILPGANNPQPFAAPSGTGPAPPRSKNMTDTNATVVPQPGQAPPGTPAATPGARNAAPVDKTNPYASEVPEVPVGHDMPGGKGVVQPGIDPIRQAARVEGLKNFNENIEPAATDARHTQASLGVMKSELDRGVTTDRLAELKTTVGGFLYGVTKDADFVKKATGLDVSNQEVFNKESTRMGLTFARKTEGAREAVAAIRIALGANPSLLNTEEGNRKIIAIMDQGAKYDVERAKAAQAYMQKNDGHLTGFDNWWNQNHPPESFTSKAIPYPSKVNGIYIRKTDMKPGVTYEYGGENGNDFKGTWDGSHFHAVKQ